MAPSRRDHHAAQHVSPGALSVALLLPVVTAQGEGRLVQYDNRSGMCDVDVHSEPIPQRASVDPCDQRAAPCGRRVRLHWRVVSPLHMQCVPFGQRGRLCGGARPGAEVRVNGFQMDGDRCRVLYVLAEGDGTVWKGDVDSVAPAELLYSVDTLHHYIECMPPNVQALTLTVVSEAMDASKFCARDSAGKMRCRKSDLRASLCQLADESPATWDGLLGRCMNRVVKEDKDYVRMVVHSLRGLAQHCAAQERDERQGRIVNGRAWAQDVLDVPRKHKRSKRKKKKRKKHKR